MDMLFATLVTVLGLALIVAGALWRQQRAPVRLLLIIVGVLLLLWGGWALLDAVQQRDRTQPRSWAAPVNEPAPDLAIAFKPEALLDSKAPREMPSESAPLAASTSTARTAELQPAASPADAPKPESPQQTAPKSQPKPSRAEQPLYPRAEEARQPREQAAAPTPTQGGTTRAAPRRSKSYQRASTDDEDCCVWYPADGMAADAVTVDDSYWQDSALTEPPAESVAPRQLLPAQPNACQQLDPRETARICVVIRNQLGEQQQAESLQLFVEGRPMGRFELNFQQAGQQLAVPLTRPGRYGYRLLGHVDYPEGRYMLDSTGVFDARADAILDVRITEWRDHVYLEALNRSPYVR